MMFENRIHEMINLGLQETSLYKVKSYIDFLWSSNSALNLFSRQMSFQELIDNHLIDCLLPLNQFPMKNVKDVADFGSGSGLPGVLYAINFPEINFHLFEKSLSVQNFFPFHPGSKFRIYT